MLLLQKHIDIDVQKQTKTNSSLCTDRLPEWSRLHIAMGIITNDHPLGEPKAIC